MNVSIAGRYLVYAPQGSGVGVSRRLTESERDRLRKMVDRTYKGPGRADRPHRRPRGEKIRLRAGDRLPAQAQRRARAARPSRPRRRTSIFQEADLPVRVLRDVFLSDFETAIIDSQKQFERVTSFFQRTAPELVDGGRALRGQEAAVREMGDRQGDRVDPQPARRPALGRLPDHRLRRGADRDRRQQRQLHRPRQRRPRGDDHPGQHRGRRRGRSGSCGCATSAASSSSTSSTWRGPATATKC